MQAHHGHTHAEGTPHHDHDEVMEVFEGEPLKVRFVAADGTELTVHFRDGELRVCGSVALGARQHRGDVIAVKSIEFADGWQRKP